MPRRDPDRLLRLLRLLPERISRLEPVIRLYRKLRVESHDRRQRHFETMAASLPDDDPRKKGLLELADDLRRERNLLAARSGFRPRAPSSAKEPIPDFDSQAAKEPESMNRFMPQFTDEALIELARLAEADKKRPRSDN